MSSQHKHGYAYDLFLSYSSRNGEWVRQFYDDLLADMKRFTTEVSVFLDTARLSPGYIWEEKMLDDARDSAILLPILSPTFFESEYCRAELDAFLESHGLPASGQRSRVMPVYLLSRAPRGHVLDEIQGSSFFTTSHEGVPLELRHGSDPYTKGIRTLAHAAVKTLSEIPRRQTPLEEVFRLFGPALLSSEGQLSIDAVNSIAGKAQDRTIRRIRVEQAPHGIDDPIYELKSGTRFRFRIQPAKSSYLYVFNLDPASGVTLLFPNSAERLNRIPAKTLKYVPDETKAQLVVDTEAGTEYFLALCTEKQILMDVLQIPTLLTSKCVDMHWKWSDAIRLFRQMHGVLKTATPGWWAARHTTIAIKG